MVVDDHPRMREAICMVLDLPGGVVVVGEASTGEEAVGLVPKVDPDVILMDVRMPEMGGIEATRRVKQLRPSVAVVALTSWGDDPSDMLEAGASDYLVKPSDGDHILNAILNAVTQAARGGWWVSHYLARWQSAAMEAQAHWSTGETPVQSDDFGSLWRWERSGGEPLVWVQVINSTPEPDGSFKDYFLRVPPWMTTAREAVAWTFGEDEESYAPDVQT